MFDTSGPGNRRRTERVYGLQTLQGSNVDTARDTRIGLPVLDITATSDRATSQKAAPLRPGKRYRFGFPSNQRNYKPDQRWTRASCFGPACFVKLSIFRNREETDSRRCDCDKNSTLRHMADTCKIECQRTNAGYRRYKTVSVIRLLRLLIHLTVIVDRQPQRRFTPFLYREVSTTPKQC